MGWKAIREEIRKRLLSVDGIHTVYEYVRDLNNPDDIDESVMMPGNRQLSVWQFTRNNVSIYRGPDRGVPTSQSIVEHSVIIEGIYGFNDERATELEWQDIIDRVIDVLVPTIHLGNTAELVYDIVVREIGFTRFGNILCHSCKISMKIAERITNVQWS